MSGAPLEPARLSGDAKRSYVRDMFTAIAPRYDLLNHLLSLNIDRGWRRTDVSRLAWDRAPAGRFLDACVQVTGVFPGSPPPAHNSAEFP